MAIVTTMKNNAIAQDDPINHPAHYTYGTIETIDFINDKEFNFNLGNVIKYVTRAGHKNDAIQDLKKAAWYLANEIEVRERKLQK